MHEALDSIPKITEESTDVPKPKGWPWFFSAAGFNHFKSLYATGVGDSETVQVSANLIQLLSA